MTENSDPTGTREMPHGEIDGSAMGRRRFLTRVVASAAAVTAAGSLPVGAGGVSLLGGTAGALDPRFTGKRRVAILGGGCAGLSAAHELVERGFTVDVYERYPVAGGKCRSIPVPGTGTSGRADLPGEHGFRFFPGYYKHVTDTMRRIPYGSNRNGVKDNLVFGDTALFSRNGAPDIPFPYKKLLTLTPADLPQLIEVIVGVLALLPGLSIPEITYFATRVAEFATSCDDRRVKQYDKLDWWTFVRAKEFGPLYQNILTRSLTRNLVAAQAEKASTRTIGLQATRILLANIIFSMYEEASRILNGPTSEVWIDPWMSYLAGKGMRWHPNSEVEGLVVEGGVVTGARIRNGSSVETVTADVFVLAVPVEQARRILDAPLRALDPGFAKLDNLVVDWMTGAQFFLSQRLPIAKGHVTYVDSPWALTSISQGQFWNRDLSRYGNGRVRDILSVDISNWDAKGILYGKTAKQCTKTEIFNEVWAQMKRSLDWGWAIPDSIVVDRFLDPAIKFGPAGTPVDNAEPLLVNTVDSWASRPEAKTRIPNLFLASDYVRHNADLATMEGANEAARRAVNGILDLVGWSGTRASIWDYEEPALFGPLRRNDQTRFNLGLPHVLADTRPYT
ncbi:MAG: FAD-dependent oxidoreductase [Acidimicrobiales bacterium]|nr:FAD-dependent oxidoreductase [Acidimicrobiales bacterium]